MKSMILPLLILARVAMADVEITPDEARTIPAVDLQDLERKSIQLDGKIVKLRFNQRGTDVARTADGLTGTLSFTQDRRALRMGTVAAIVPQDGVEWFMKISSDWLHSTRAHQMVAFARITTSGRLTATLLGREIKTDLKGSKIVWGSGQ